MTLDEYCSKKLFVKSTNSKCYLIGKEQDRVLKIFNVPFNKENVEKFEYFLDYKNDSFIFPHEFIVYGDKFLGYVTQRSNGKELEKVIDKIDFVTYSKRSKKLEEDIVYVSNGKILINDISTRNILYEKELLRVIDPDFYKVYCNSSVNEVLNYNMKVYKSCIADLFILPYLRMKKKPDKYVVEKINQYMKSDINTSEFIINLKLILEDYYDSEINNLREFNKILRR